tara:strand:- start:1392 stop:1547 length:156 start_codon:yes stop_codon:yes gene_type:complete
MKKEKEEAIKIESDLRMKSTAALKKEVAQEMNEEDKPLKELLSDDETENTE